MTTTFKNGLGKYDTGFYYYCFRLDGRQFRGNTQTKDLVLARKVLAQKKEEAKQTLAREAENLGLNQSLKDSPSPIEVPTISELVKEWTESHSSVVSDSHLRSIGQVARIWLLPTFGDKPINQIGTPEVLELRTRILNAKRSPATANHIGRVVKLLWNFAVTTGRLEQVPFKLKPLRIQKKPRPFITAERVPEFLAMVDERVKNHQVRVILRVMLGLGMRASEVLGMRWEWFDPEQRLYIVGRAKGKEARVLPVPAWLWDAIHALPRGENEWVFPADDGAQRRAQFARMPLMRVCKRLGLCGMSQHRLRASFATLHSNAGTPLPDLQSMMGHKSITTTMIYIEQTLESKRKAQDNLTQKLGLA